MKKLRLSALELGAKEVLTREQLKKVLGGAGTACSATVTCNSGPTITCSCPSGGVCSAGDEQVSCSCDVAMSGGSGQSSDTYNCPSSGSSGSGGS